MDDPNKSQTTNNDYLFSFDLGTSSIGWAVFNSGKLVDAGVRIFPEGMDRTRGEKSLNQDRRTARALRRQTYRRARRKQHVLNQLVRMGLLPDNDDARATLFSLDPYPLRAQATTQALSAHELGRALYHLAQRRGYKSNRKTGTDNEDGVVLTGIGQLEHDITEAGCETLGQLFHQLDPRERRVRGHYTARAMYESEFDLLIERQRVHHPKALNLLDVKRLRDAIFYQRPLRLQKHLIGHCPFEPDRRRAAAATLAAQEFRLWQNLNNLKIIHRNGDQRWLSTDERLALAEALATQKQMAWGKVRTLLDLDDNHEFNLEKVRKTGMLGNQTAAIVSGVLGKKAWKQLAARERERLVFELLNIEEPDSLHRRLSGHWGLDDDRAQTLMDKALGLPRGTMHLSHKALRRVTEQLKSTDDNGRGPTYDKACAKAGYDFKAESKAPPKARLPFPGKAAKLDPKRPRLDANGNDRRRRDTLGAHDEATITDTSHIGDVRNPLVTRTLFQLRRVVNALIARYDTPKRVNLELARDLKLTPKQRALTEKRNRDNERANQEAADRLREDFNIANPRRSDLLKFRLWQEAKHQCPYCDRSIGAHELFSADGAQIEHIIPYSRSMDDSFNNKTVAHARCNADKNNLTPWEAFTGADYEAMLQRIAPLPWRKRRLFSPNALQNADGGDRNFVSQQMNETRFMSRKALDYLRQLGCDVVVLSGRTTALLRKVWGLNGLLGDTGEKNRNDHRHHAVDAIVIGLTNLSAVRKLSRAAYFGEDHLRFHADQIPSPIPNLRHRAAEMLDRLVVAHKSHRRVRGPLHEETLYAVTGESTEKGQPLVAVRKKLAELDARKLHLIRDESLRAQALAHLATHNGNFKNAFQDKNNPFRPKTRNGSGNPVRHVRLLFPATTEDIGDKDKRNLRHILTGNNHHIEIFAFEDTGRWSGKVVSKLEALHRLKAGDPVISTDHGIGRRFVMALHINDMLQLTIDGETDFWRVKKMDRNNNIVFQSHRDASDTKEPLKKTPNSLRALNPVLLEVDPIGLARPVVQIG
ncbi:MAG: type II CRISPR RNA-guided endonuclease Cas9 [Gammaproteobacteria bacterium]|nr:type II CRISPR RNA-guided endonuclease Cas9 [Gammaproteobacteria bacterium]